MPTLTTTGKRKLKINRLTQTMFSSATTSNSELYLVDPEFTGSKALVTNASGDIVESSVTATELDYCSGVTSSIQTQLNSKQGAFSNTSVTLTSAGWSSNTQTVTVSGMTATKIVWVSPAPASSADYSAGGVYCSAQGSNSLTFTCATQPSVDITVNVIFG